MKVKNVFTIAIGIMVLSGVLMMTACTNDKKSADQEQHSGGHAETDSAGKEILTLSDQDVKHANI